MADPKFASLTSSATLATGAVSATTMGADPATQIANLTKLVADLQARLSTLEAVFQFSTLPLSSGQMLTIKSAAVKVDAADFIVVGNGVQGLKVSGASVTVGGSAASISANSTGINLQTTGGECVVSGAYTYVTGTQWVRIVAHGNTTQY